MTGFEIVQKVRKDRGPETAFIKWWYADKDLVEYELVDDFLARVKSEEVFDGFCLLSMNEMWEILTSLDPDRMTRTTQGQKEFIEWRWNDAKGREKRTIYSFTPQSILSLMNEEFFS